MDNLTKKSFAQIKLTLDQGPIGSRTNCCEVLSAMRRVAFILPYNGDYMKPKVLPGGWVSQNVHSELGWYPDEILHDLRRFIHPDDRHWMLFAGRTTSPSDTVRLRLATKDGGYCWALAEGSITADKIVGSFKVIRGNIRGFGSDSGGALSTDE